jgi:type I restriction enzyme S subunit
MLDELKEVISKGTTPRKDDVVGLEEKIPFLKVRDISKDGNLATELDLIPEEVHVKQLKRSILKKDDLIFSIAGTIGRVSIIPARLDNANCNQAVAFIRLKEKNMFNWMSFLTLKSERVQKEIQGKVVQAVQANTSLRNISDIEVLKSSEEVLKQFNSKVSSVYKKIEINKLTIQELITTRDTLLPKLISGKIKV